MTLALFRDAWSLWRRERDLLLAVAAPWLFLPALALALLVSPPPPIPAVRDEMAGQAWAEALLAWAGRDGGWYLVAHLLALFGAATLYALLIGGGTVRLSMAAGVRAVPRLLLASLLTGPLVVLGLTLWLVPGLYAMARLALVGPMLVVERRGVLAAIGASVRQTQGHGAVLLVAVAVPLLGGWLAGQPFATLDAMLRATGQGNPVAIAMVAAGSAAVALAGGLAQALIVVSAYRRLAR